MSEDEKEQESQHDGLTENHSDSERDAIVNHKGTAQIAVKKETVVIIQPVVTPQPMPVQPVAAPPV